MQDGYGRIINYLRVSVTDKCNLRCVYCMPPEGVERTPHDQILSFEETLRICAAAAGLGINKIKITGGEPLVRRGLASFIHSLKHQRNIKTVTLTTNGLTLSDFLKELLDAGLDAVNISLDTLNNTCFRRITRSNDLQKVIHSIEDACKTQLTIKINCVPMRGVNENDIVPLAELARQTEIIVRFIELMPIGLGSDFSPIPQDEIFEQLQSAFGVLTPSDEQFGNGPAAYYSAAGFIGKIGFISALSHNFCGMCNRLRLTGTGLLKPCLSSDAGIDLKAIIRDGGGDAEIADAIRAAVMAKPARHNFRSDNNQHKKKNMFRIGG
jgi:cyclic pyranopterin phosphate synthase